MHQDKWLDHVADAVGVSTSEGRIWNLQEFLVGLLAQGRRTVNLRREGPCCQATGIYDVLDQVTGSLGQDPAQYRIITRNLLEKSDRYEIIRHGNHFVDLTNRANLQPVELDPGAKLFGIMIGRSSWDRLVLSSQLWNRYPFYSWVTYHYDPASDYHRGHAGLDDIARWYDHNQPVLTAARFLEHCPRTQQTHTYPLLVPANLDAADLYRRFMIEVVCETYIQGQTFFPTEKTFRAIAMGRPFLTMGPKNFLGNLRRLGFKTFAEFWNEDYDSAGENLRIDQILEIIDRLSKMTTAEQKDLWQQLQDICDHNRQHLATLTAMKTLEIFKDV